MHSAFNFDFLACPWEPDRLRSSIVATLAHHAPVGAPATWVLSNHDVTRHVTRYGRTDTRFDFAAKTPEVQPVDLALGTRRARAAALLTMALPGAVYVYQGEELGLPEVEDLPKDVLQDPMFFRSNGADPGRDGCRVPLPWDGASAPFGFSDVGPSAGAWLPQPPEWSRFTVSAQLEDADSMLELYRTAIHMRRASTDLRQGSFEWLEAPPGVLAFRRGDRFGCAVNLSPDPATLPAHRGIILSSGALEDGRLPSDTAVWLELA